MVQRTRTRFTSAGTGTKSKLNGDLVGTYTNFGSSESITDNVLPGDGHPLSIRKLQLSGCIISDASSPGSISGRRLKNLQPDLMRNSGAAFYNHLNITSRPSDAVLAAQLIADTNPSRPVVDLPIAVYELREIPDLLRREGGGWIRKLASANLKYHFGIKPLVNDVVSLLNFSDEVAKRQKELETLAERGLRRTRNLWSSSLNSTSDVTVHSLDKFLIDCKMSKITRYNVRGFVEWFPDDPRMMKGDARRLARNAVLGLTIDFATAWNAIPWSWLVDWCSNVGDILIARRNIVGASHGPIQLMDYLISDCDCYFYRSDLIPNSGENNWRLENKNRKRVTRVPPSVRLPILNPRQLSILGSIGVTRRSPSYLRSL